MIEKYTVKSENYFIMDSHRYKSEKGEISLVYPTSYTGNTFEIYCIDGDLFEDVERYETLKQAEKRIVKLLK